MAESSASHINGSMECNSYDFCASAGIAASSADQPQQQQPAAAAPTPAAEHQESEHPFETDPGDHAETPFEAYDHLDLLLTRLAKYVASDWSGQTCAVADTAPLMDISAFPP